MGEIIKSEDLDSKEIVVYQSVESNKVEEDFNHARENIYKTIETSNEALDQMLKIAHQSQHPAAYDVLNNMMKVMANLNKDLVELQKKKKEIYEDKIEKPNERVKSVTNHNTFVGSTAELAEALNKRKENE